MDFPTRAKPLHTYRAIGFNGATVIRRTRQPDSIEKVILKFWKRVEKTDWCWNWTGRKVGKGYGILDLNATTMQAHRFSWVLHHGKIPDGMLVCHHCDNPGCVRPDHLFVGDDSANMQDMLRKGRGNKAKGEKNSNAKLTEAQVRQIVHRGRAGESRKTLALECGVSPRAVDFILQGRNWKHLNLNANTV